MKPVMKAASFMLKLNTFMKDKLLLHHVIIVKMNSPRLGCFSHYISQPIQNRGAILDQCLKQYFTLSTKHLLIEYLVEERCCVASVQSFRKHT